MAKNSMTSFDKDITMEIKEDEELLWRGTPQKASFVLSKSVQLLPIALIWLCFDGFAITMIFKSDVPKSMLPFLLIFFAFHLLPVWMWIYQILSARRKHKLIEYAFTSQRVIVREQGILKSYYYKDMRNVAVKVGLIDKLFKVGDITLHGSRAVTLLDIDSPYDVANKLQQFIESFAEERKKQARLRKKYVERENYFEDPHGHGDFDDEGEFYDDGFDDDEYYDEDQYTPVYSDKYEAESRRFSKNVINLNGRYTSKKKSPSEEKTEEDDYLDNIMDSINKKDEL